MINHLGSGRGWKDTLPTPLVIQGGPPTSYNWVEITPITRVIRTVSHLFSAIYRGYNSIYNCIRGPPCREAAIFPPEGPGGHFAPGSLDGWNH